MRSIIFATVISTIAAGGWAGLALAQTTAAPSPDNSAMSSQVTAGPGMSSGKTPSSAPASTPGGMAGGSTPSAGGTISAAPAPTSSTPGSETPSAAPTPGNTGSSQ